jgi:hypothetical protein
MSPIKVNGTLFIIKNGSKFVATLTLPMGVLIAEEDLVAYEVSDGPPPLGTNEQKSFDTLQEAQQYFRTRGITLRPLQ